MARIVVSFKNTSKDMKIYMQVKEMEEQSQFIKDSIEHYLNYLKEKK